MTNYAVSSSVRSSRRNRQGNDCNDLDCAIGSRLKGAIDEIPGASMFVVHHTRKATSDDISTGRGRQLHLVSRVGLATPPAPDPADLLRHSRSDSHGGVARCSRTRIAKPHELAAHLPAPIRPDYYP